MKKSVLIVATAATLLTGHGSRAQTVQATTSNYPGRLLICLSEWDKVKLSTKPDDKELTKYGRQFFVSGCNHKLCLEARSKNAAVRCRD